MFSPVFQVSEFNELINNHLGLLGEIIVEGEITRIEVKQGRMIFASIKDTGSSLDIFALTHQVKNFRQLEPGMKVQVSGTSGLYKQSSRFRLLATSIEPVGTGSLQIAFEKLKSILEKEGLFELNRKRPLPKWPINIGLITAKNSSAYYDLVKILSARMSGLTLKLLPVSVQGRESVPSILKALTYVNSHQNEFDLIILARGGGSLEDLISFNNEEVARALFACLIPTISAIGHEDNWSLTDFIADARASTPSNAAELAVRDKAQLLLNLDQQQNFLGQKISRYLSDVNQTINHAVSFIKNSTRLVSSQIDHLNQNLQLRLHTFIFNYQAQVDQMSKLLSALDYHNVLNRGFSITSDIHGKIIKTVSHIKLGDVINTQLSDGVIKSVVNLNNSN